MATVSKAIGKNHAYIYQFLTKSVPKKLPEDAREALGSYFNVDPEFFRDPTEPVYKKPPNELPQKNHDYSFSQPNVHPLMATDKVPVYGYVAGSTDRVAINEGRIIGMRDRGPALAYAREGFYVMVIGDSMEPRLRPGEYVAVNPVLPPIRGDECVVQFINAEAIVKTFVSQTADTLTVSQYNPKKNLTFHTNEVLSVYPVVAIEKGR